jgi:hypothetical protein
VAPERLIGDQRPRISWSPPSVSSSGREAVELAAGAGLKLDPWQQFLLEQGFGEAPDGRWAAFEVAMMLSRQNGKGSVLEAVALAGLFLFGDRFIGWSAHEFKTAQEGFLRVRALIDSSDDLRRSVARVRTSHGEEGIELLSGQRLRFMARSTGSGRGFSGQRLILDESQHLGEAAIEAILPTMSAQENPQVWYAATAPDPALAPCEVLARLRKRALAGDDPSLVYAEWSIDPHVAECSVVCKEHDDPARPASWARSNPALGIRITPEHVAREMASMSAGGFARERLGVGAWPADERAWEVISEEEWAKLEDQRSEIVGPLVLAADQPPDASWGAIAAVGRRADGLLHAEVVDHKPRTSWMAGRLLELQDTHHPLAIVIDPTGPANSLIGPLLAAGYTQLAPMAPAPSGGKVLLRPFAREMSSACAQFLQAATDSRDLRHLGQAEVNAALAGARKRPLGDSWAWTRKGSGVDISPLVACTLALWGFGMREHVPQTTEPQSYFWDPDAKDEDRVAVQA